MQYIFMTLSDKVTEKLPRSKINPMLTPQDKQNRQELSTADVWVKW